jgi:hypothetical protein
VEWIRYRSGAEWGWIYKLPSGWAAAVIDDSQSADPPRATEYRVSALSGDHGYQRGGTYPTLEEAKREALLLAMAQPDVACYTVEIGA